MPEQGRVLSLPFPASGVVRQPSVRDGADNAPGRFSPWAVNVCLEDSIDRRMRGGSRTGLTRLIAAGVVSDMLSVNTGSSSGTGETLYILGDGSAQLLADGSLSDDIVYLVNDSGDYLTDESGNLITLGTGTAPAASESAFLVAGQQHVLAITTSSVRTIDVKTGNIDVLTATSGAVPTGCTLGAVYRDRLCLTGEDNAIYMSRQGDYGDWDFGAHFEDEGRAVPFQLSLASEVGATPTALIPHKDRVMLAATSRSLWLISGDPTTGELRRISEHTGIIAKRAWCRVDDTVLFLAADGMYSVGVDGSGLQRLSEVIPEELRDIDLTETQVRLGYHHDRRAVHVYLITDGGGETHWTFEMRTGAFWPMRMDDWQRPTAVCQYAGNLVLAGGDGILRTVGGDDDDGEAIESHLLLGPMRLGSVDYLGMIRTLHGILAAGSGTVTWRIVTGDSAEEAADNGKAAIEAFQAGESYSSYVHSSGEWTAGRSLTSRPRTRAMWACLWLQSTGQWAFEGATAQIAPAGRWR